MSEQPVSDDFQRGKEAGEVMSRLAGHDSHFAAINGSIDRLGDEVHQLNIKIQRFSDAAEAREKTTAATAEALAAADETRRAEAEHKWSGFQRFFAVIACLAAVITIASILYTTIGK